ncbi:MAG: hypothetical protein KTR17_05750 [Cellvibrionaceae bacterium]|nr:hypothetical protein [Cellvibrionaceae bacterium]
MTELTEEMRQAIALAKHREQEHRALYRYLERKIPALHHSISLPEQGATEALLRFVSAYIECVPEFIEALSKLARQAGVARATERFLAIAAEFFLSPPEIISQTSGLKDLLGEAYLAHRLIEEINDRMMMLSGVPFSPMDMTLSNVIVQDVLDSEFVNQLDLAVHYAIESLFDAKQAFKDADFNAYLQNQQSKGWTEAIANWPCLAGDSEITLNLPGLSF